MSDSKAVLSVDHLGHVYQSGRRSLVALDDISFEVLPSQMVAIQGDSGSGKTTMLLACGGMQPPTSGSVLLNGQDLYAIPTLQRSAYRAQHVGYLFQTLELIPYLNLTDNVRMANGVSRKTAESILERLGLADRWFHKPDSLSHGQRQRAALARALAHRPSLVVADEPTGNLDARNTTLVMETLRQFANDGGAVLVATHDQSVESFADQVLQISTTRLANAGI